MLGSDLVPMLRQHVPTGELIAVGHEGLDITREEQAREKVEAIGPAVIINCAAYTDVDGCEGNRELAFRVNAGGPAVLAGVAAEAGALLVHLSTDFVFDGTKREPYVEGDRPHPLSVYGESKLAGEESVRQLTEDHLIVRTAWLYGRHGPNFVDTMLRLASEREELAVVTDQTGSPTWTVELARALIALLQADARGTFHVVGAGSCTRFEWAGEVLRLAGMKAALRPATSAHFPRPAQRPAHSVLSPEKLARETGFRMRPWHEALAEYLRKRAAT